jgi:hypothetical protein
VHALKLLEKAGIILKPREEIVKRGVFRGKVPKGVKRSVWSGKLQFEWDYVREGELVLTNGRLIAIGNKPWLGLKGIIVYPSLSFKAFTAVREGYEGELLLFLGRDEITLEVDNASQWARAIKEQCRKEEPKESEEKERKGSEKNLKRNKGKTKKRQNRERRLVSKA